MSEELLAKALRAICLTRDYVGEDLLPPIEGWEWFDAGKALADEIPKDMWAKQFWMRVLASDKNKTFVCRCRLCGCDVWEASERGAFHKRVNETGVAGIWECRPSCDRTTGNQEDALIGALNDEQPRR